MLSPKSRYRGPRGIHSVSIEGRVEQVVHFHTVDPKTSPSDDVPRLLRRSRCQHDEPERVGIVCKEVQRMRATPPAPWSMRTNGIGRGEAGSGT